MSSWLVNTIGLAYVYGAVEQAVLGNVKMSLLLLSYAAASFVLATMQ